jgi:hypothetical protein
MTIQFISAGLTPDSLPQQSRCRDLCRAHGGALVAVARLVLDDAQDVCEVVAEAIAAECRDLVTAEVGPTGTRQRLARSVFDRSRGRLVTRERFGLPAVAPSELSSDEMPSVLGSLSAEVRAAVALTVFGRHGLTEAASVLGISPDTVLRRLREALAAAHRAVGAVAISGWDEVGQSTGDSRRRRRGNVDPRQRFASANQDAATG